MGNIYYLKDENYKQFKLAFFPSIKGSVHQKAFIKTLNINFTNLCEFTLQKMRFKH